MRKNACDGYRGVIVETLKSTAREPRREGLTLLLSEAKALVMPGF